MEMISLIDKRISTAACLAAALLLAFAIALPASGQSSPDTQACQGSTVDLQGADVAKRSRAFLAELQQAVSSGNKNKVAAMVAYPLLVIHKGRKTHIKTKSAFLSSYGTIFDEHVRKAVAQQTSKCLFGNYQGAMIGNGEVWLAEQANGTMKIITVNPSAGS
jgi:hypothetical protein